MAENETPDAGTPGTGAEPPKTDGAEPQGIETPGAETQATTPPLVIRAHYLKDLSFENPKAPEILMELAAPPDIQVSVNVDARTLSENDFEVELTLTGEAKSGEATVFVVEITYAGVFTLQNVAPEHRAPLLLIECPRLLFPFARRVVVDVTGEGGFPPLAIQPIDFVALFQQHVAHQQQEGAQPA